MAAAVALGVAGKMAQAVLKGLDEHIVQSVLLVVRCASCGTRM